MDVGYSHPPKIIIFLYKMNTCSQCQIYSTLSQRCVDCDSEEGRNLRKKSILVSSELLNNPYLAKLITPYINDPNAALQFNKINKNVYSTRDKELELSNKIILADIPKQFQLNIDKVASKRTFIYFLYPDNIDEIYKMRIKAPKLLVSEFIRLMKQGKANLFFEIKEKYFRDLNLTFNYPLYYTTISLDGYRSKLKPRDNRYDYIIRLNESNPYDPKSDNLLKIIRKNIEDGDGDEYLYYISNLFQLHLAVYSIEYRSTVLRRKNNKIINRLLNLLKGNTPKKFRHDFSLMHSSVLEFSDSVTGYKDVKDS